MEFIYYDLIFLFAFVLFVIIFLYRKRKNLERQGAIYLYKTKLGIKFIDRFAEKREKALHIIKYFSISMGYLLMAGILFLIGYSTYSYITKFQELISLNLDKTPPVMLLLPYFPKIFGVQSFFPEFYFTYFIVSILVVAVVHEFSHGIYARLYNLKIKSTGFAFLGPIIGAFVEPDEAKMKKVSNTGQRAILSAGVFANIITAILAFVILLGLFYLTFVPSGAVFSNYIPGIVNSSKINMIDGINVGNFTRLQMIDIIDKNNFTTTLQIKVDGETRDLIQVNAKNQTFFIQASELKKQLEKDIGFVLLYEDYPAIRAGLKGVIIQIDNKKIKTHEELANTLDDYSVGDEIKIKTVFNNETQDYTIKLKDDGTGRSVIGVTSYNIQIYKDANGKLMISYSADSDSKNVLDFLIFFKKPFTYYGTQNEFLVFIYYLVYWVFLINLMVGFFNMLPFSILDGGRFFYLTVLAITKKEKVSNIIYKTVGMLILLMFLVMIFIWLFRFF